MQFSDIRLEGPGNKLNVHAQEFMMRGLELQNSRSSSQLYQQHQNNLNAIQNSKSSGNIQHQIQLAQQNQQIIHHLQQQQQQRMLLQQRASHLGLHQSSHLPLVNSPSSGNILHVSWMLMKS